MCHFGNAHQRVPEAVVFRRRDNYRVVPVKAAHAAVGAVSAIGEAGTVREADVDGVERGADNRTVAMHDVVYLVIGGQVFVVESCHVIISS
nr:MAG TPA: hypothetical protein [Caudoviricetes sp.]